MTRLFLIALLIAAVFGQSTATSSPPEHFDYFQGHGLGGYERFTWENGKRVLVKRTPGRDDKDGYHEVIEQFDPSPQDWERFWKALEAAGVWEWKANYPSAIDVSDGAGWSLEVRHANRSLKSQGYNNQPPEFGAFRSAVNQLLKDSRSKPTRP